MEFKDRFSVQNAYPSLLHCNERSLTTEYSFSASLRIRTERIQINILLVRVQCPFDLFSSKHRIMHTYASRWRYRFALNTSDGYEQKSTRLVLYAETRSKHWLDGQQPTLQQNLSLRNAVFCAWQICQFGFIWVLLGVLGKLFWFITESLDSCPTL